MKSKDVMYIHLVQQLIIFDYVSLQSCPNESLVKCYMTDHIIILPKEILLDDEYLSELASHIFAIKQLSRHV